MTPSEHHYQDMLLRWLRVKRDMPWNTEPEPTIVVPWNGQRERVEELRKRTIFDLERNT